MIDEEEVESMLEGIIENLRIIDCHCMDSNIVYDKQGVKNIKDMLDSFYTIKVNIRNPVTSLSSLKR